MTSQFYISVIVVTARILLNVNKRCAAATITKSFTKHDGYQASGRVLRTMTVTVDADCGSQCVAERACDAFNVETGMVDGTRACELMTADNESPAVIAAAGWATYIGNHIITRYHYVCLLTHQRSTFHILLAPTTTSSK